MLSMYADVKGHVVDLGNGIVAVPYEATSGGWYCVVVKGTEAYKVGGYNIFVREEELGAGKRLEVLSDAGGM